MGGFSSKTSSSKPSVVESISSSRDVLETVVEWKILPSSNEARKKFEDDGTLSKGSTPDQLELRIMLDEVHSQNAIANYAKTVKALDVFMCWIDIQDFKSIPVESYRRSKALHIYHKYIKTNAILQIQDIPEADRAIYKAAIDLSTKDQSILSNEFYGKVQAKCFSTIYLNIYRKFKKTNEYKQLTEQIRKKYNKVRINDFEYFNKLG